MRENTMTVTEYLRRFDTPDAAVRRALECTYGSDPDTAAHKAALWRGVLTRFHERFGDRPVCLLRSPGRINLRGMHVDTHGGYLNLMTHQREVAVVAAAEPDDAATFVNVDPQFDEVSFRLADQTTHPAFSEDWVSFITNPDIQGPVLERRGHWGNYLTGAMLRVQHEFRGHPLRGVAAAVTSDLPRGAALSSSTALSMAVIAATLSLNGQNLHPDDYILVGKYAEWYTGARGGTSDQAAMVLGDRGSLVNVALFSDELDTSTARSISFPEELAVLVVNSFTERSLSGAQLVEYTRNRFAYSLALAILQQEMAAQGMDSEFVDGCDRLSRLTADAFEPFGGIGALYGLLKRIPKDIPLDDLRSRYDLPNLDAAYNQYFGTVPEALRPTRIGLRGPLLFGIAESERARVFPDAFYTGDFERAGRLMTAGHDGDRRVSADGTPYVCDVSDPALDRFAAARTPIEMCPGVYGASSPVLDALVDAALEGGALGASLTGAGIAGTVLALCRRADADRVTEAIRTCIASRAYADRAGWDEPLGPDKVAQSVMVNRATRGVGGLCV